MTGEGNSKRFEVGELVESVFDKGTVYRIVELDPPRQGDPPSVYLRLELVKAGEDTFQYGISDRKGRMGDGQLYSPYHFNPA